MKKYIIIFILVMGLVGLVTEYWYVCIPLACVLIYLAYKVYHVYALAQYGNVNYDNMNNDEFKHFCSGLLKDIGYDNVGIVQGDGEYGIGIIAQKGSKSYAIQCKCELENVDDKAVQEVYLGKESYDTNYVVIMTNRYFTPQARKKANEWGILLWDRGIVDSYIHKAVFIMQREIKRN